MTTLSKTDIDLDALIAAVRNLAAENPDFVYERGANPDRACLYQRDGKPSCIVGQGFYRLGFTIDDLRIFDTYAIDLDDPDFVGKQGTGVEDVLCHDFGLRPTDDFDLAEDPRVDWLRLVQSKQDTGARWAEAVEYADWVYPVGA